MLAVVGSGEYLPAMADVDRALLGLAGATGATPRVVCVPAAAGTEGDAMIDDWMHRGVDHFAALGADAVPVRVWDRVSANDPDLAAQIDGADFVYLSGGKPSYLHEVLDGSRAWDAILGVVEGGGLLTGCSAGAMIQGEVFPAAPKPRPGFGLWPGMYFVPHFDEIPSTVVSAMRLALGRKRTLVGVPANTAFVEVDGSYRVIGDRVTVWGPKDRNEFPEGDVPSDAFDR